MIYLQKQVTKIGTKFIASTTEKINNEDWTFITSDKHLFRCPYEALNHLFESVLETYASRTKTNEVNDLREYQECESRRE